MAVESPEEAAHQSDGRAIPGGGLTIFDGPTYVARYNPSTSHATIPTRRIARRRPVFGLAIVIATATQESVSPVQGVTGLACSLFIIWWG